jgi:hypothetical protein
MEASEELHKTLEKENLAVGLFVQEFFAHDVSAGPSDGSLLALLFVHHYWLVVIRCVAQPGSWGAAGASHQAVP